MLDYEDRILEIINSNSVIIKEHFEKLNDFVYIISDNNYSEIFSKDSMMEDEELFKHIDNGVRIIHITDKIFNSIKDFISNDIQKLVIPAAIFNLNCKISDFPNLGEVYCTGNSNLEVTDIIGTVENGTKLNIPMDGELGKLFDTCFVTLYDVNKSVGYNFIDIYDKREKKDSYLKAKRVSINMHDTQNMKYMKIKELDINEIVLFLEWLIRENYNVDEVIVKLENKTIDNVGLLKKYTEMFNIKIDYGEYVNASYDDFLAMREAIDWYKSLITSSDLSPFESLIFAYDILKTFAYSESLDSNDARYVHNIIKTGNIVCVGYSKLLGVILNELEINTVSCVIPPIGNDIYGHQRVLVKLDDLKYDIHGVFAVDATWDRADDNLIIDSVDGDYGDKNTDGNSLKKYDSLSLYRFFLVPYEEYKNVFGREELPDIFKILDDDANDYLWKVCGDDIFRLFKEDDRESIKSYILDSKKPNLDKFRKALRKVRLAEGYSEDNVDIIVQDVIEINKILDENCSFFKDGVLKSR